ncbi:MAG: GNAT family N-acetyltransferase [Bacteroidales bacterium]|nr:GNAT family N-acetyltransferase [Candidatus Cryptobacteroides faecihippi]MCQ2163274.1 GNAT family N-acetyltransferase [Bacteroidales bacterium]
MEITIEKGCIADRDAIVQFQVDMALESEGTVLDPATVTKGVETGLRCPEKGTYFVAKVDGIVVGSLFLTKEWSDWNNCDYWWIQSVYVLPDYRGKGVFRMLYKEVERRAVEAGSTCLRLYVDKTNERAKATYRKLGMDECHYLMYEETLR